MPKVNRKRPDAGTVRERAARFARYRDAGVPIGDAIRLALSPDPFNRKVTARAIPEFAARHGIHEKLASGAIYGSRRATDEVCAALAEELGGTSQDWWNLISPARETAAVPA